MNGVAFDKIVDKAVSAGTTAAVGGRVEKTQVNKIISIFDSVSDAVKGVVLTMSFIMRQSGNREVIDRETARVLIEHLSDFLNKYRDDKNELRRVVREYLGLFKWFYEAASGRGISKKCRSFEDFVRAFLSSR